MIQAIKKDKQLLQEMDSFLPDRNNYYLWWLGQSGFLLQWNGKRVLIDPYLSDSLTKKYEQTDKPHVRMSERVVAPELLTGITIVTSSHNHTDHLDAETLVPVFENNAGAQFIIPEANREFVAGRVQCERAFPVGLNDNRSVTIEEFTFSGVPAKHNEIERDGDGNCRYMGFVIEFGGFSIYHSGDTLWFDELVGILKPYKVDLALLPINGNRPERKVAGNLNAKEAALLARSIEAGVVIPTHYDMFTFNTADVSELAKEAARLGQACHVLKGGAFFTNKPNA